MATLESRNHPDESLLLVLGERRDPRTGGHGSSNPPNLPPSTNQLI